MCWNLHLTNQGKAVESFQRLNFRVIAVGDSFNDARQVKGSKVLDSRALFWQQLEACALSAYNTL